jgi:heat shock protein HspQ
MKPKKELAIGALKQIWKSSQRGVARKFCIGDIVEDTKNNEYGIFLAVKPLILSEENLKNLAKRGEQREMIYYTDPAEKEETCMIMTISESEKKDPTGMYPYQVRVRYTNSRFLRKVPDQSTSKIAQSLSDLENHCQNECILECTKECSLWKFRKG